MKSAIIKILDEDDEERVDAMCAQGVRRRVARVLIYLTNIESARINEIELGTGYRSYLTKSMEHLQRKGWVTAKKIKIDKKHSYLLYSLRIPIDEIVDEMIKE